MSENRSGKVDMKDLSLDVVRRLVKYMYTGRVENIYVKTEELLAGADKYNLTGLKRMCEDSLIAATNVNNWVDMIIVADLYHACNLREAAKKTIEERGADFVKLDDWKEKLKAFPDIFCEVF